MYQKSVSCLFLFIALFSCQQNEDQLPTIEGSPEQAFQTIEKKLPQFFRNVDSALVYSNQLVLLAKQINLPEYLGKAYNTKASALEQVELYDSAIWYFEQAMPMLIAAQDTSALAFNYSGLGHIYLYKGLHDISLSQYQKTLELLSDIEDKTALSKAYSNIGIVLMERGMYAQATDYYQQAIGIAKEQETIQVQLPPLLNLSLAYLKQEAYDSAIFYASHMKELSEQVQMDFGVGKATYILAEAYTAQGHFQKADAEARLGESIFIALNSMRDLSGLRYQRARVSHKLGNAGEALKIIDQMLDKTLNEELKVDVLRLRAEIYESQGKSSQSLIAYKVYMEATEDLANKKNEQLIVQQQFKFDSEQKSRQIKDLKAEATIASLKLNQERILLYVVLAFILILVLTAYLFFTRHKAKAQAEVMELQNKLLRTQLNPHFLFNAMGAIQQYIYSHEDPQLISDYLGRFSRLTRMILNYSKQELITLEEELEFLKTYIALQQIRFEIPFEFNLNLSAGLQTDQLLVPPMLTQPFIENAIEHGFLHKEEQGHINLSIKEANNQLLITVEDDGIGRIQAATLAKKTKHESLATQITIERLKLLQRKLKQKSNLLIKDLRDQQQKVSGTLVELNIPLIKD